MLNLLPKDDKYFDRFSEMAQRIHESARILDGFFNGAAPASTVADQIKRLEHECDEISHEILRRIDRTFITPIDRDDIHRLAVRLDDVIDLIDGTGPSPHPIQGHRTDPVRPQLGESWCASPPSSSRA